MHILPIILAFILMAVVIRTIIYRSKVKDHVARMGYHYNKCEKACESINKYIKF